MVITGKVALVAGGTSGLGLAVAATLLAAGARVVVTGRSEERGAKALARLGDGASFVAGDISRPADVAAAVARARHDGGPHIAVCCAGATAAGRVVGRAGPLPLTEFERIVRVNLVGTFDLVRSAAAAMAGDGDGQEDPSADEERGVIVCTSSIAAYDGQRGQAAYAASKAGIAGMTLPLARDLARHRVRVVTVAPGLFDTPMLADLPARARAALATAAPHPGRLGRPEEFAALVQHIVENPMINGEVVRIDGAARLGSGH
ncbi:SDR family NAD(P)-dependent oxidoreductase [Streptomyces sp. B93]|uniref:SDR family NAD(P)-dependent oxidoreductase n=1 Tax=Streptomyces sp. B93 TaxID=2824875 RepID=UPI001B38F583|nr:SDR family NAD(P)-dependent oxidoreductase [Streptomyces sp. B93]MBQ1089455.1 SDR family NAD(P)-dependent oxidoreductase [Streptomyces sp. B93]